MASAPLTKLKKLKAILKNYPGVVVAFSGGVDSSLLLWAAKEVLKKKVIAVTVRSETYSEEETRLSKKIARALKCRHIIIRTNELADKNFSNNTVLRCYYCKLQRFKKLKAIARRYGYSVIEGSNRDDLKDYRPGIKALHKLKIDSPLITAGLKKSEIKKLAKRLKLPNWNQPSMACLASRIPYGTKINKENLQRVALAERYLRKFISGPLRVRDHYPLARIEIDMTQAMKFIKFRKRIIRYFKRLGYRFTTLDLAGYRSGSLNP